MRFALLLLAFAPLVVSARPTADGAKVAFDALLAEMADLSHLAEFPDPPFVTKQFSSFERLSDSPRDPTTWFANHDRGFCLYEATVTLPTPFFRDGPQQGRAADGSFSAGAKVGLARNKPAIGDYVWAYAAEDPRAPGQRRAQGYVPRSALAMNEEGPVLAEMEGPGVVVHFWAANPTDGGRVKIYLDGDDKPAIHAPLAELLGGTWRAETADRKFIAFPTPFAGETGRGWNLHFPIVYAKSCKIVAEKPGLAYHIVYRSYPSGTAVEPFSLRELAKRGPELEKLRKENFEPRLAKPTLPDEAAETWAPQPLRLEADAAFERSIELADGRSGAVVAQQWRLEPLNSGTLGGVILRLTFDEEKEPQVECPLGEFFAAGGAARPFSSFPLAITADGRLQAFWTMPFEKRLKLQLENRSGQPLTLTPTLRLAARPWSSRSLHFHAKWRLDLDLPTRPVSEQTRCGVDGKGVFVGMLLAVRNPGAGWWGEGDEKLTVDGEPFPSWFGTGTDDYFGAAWADSSPFQHAYRGRLRGEGAEHEGLTRLHRFHLLEAVPFAKSFRFDLELIHTEPRTKLSLASVACWYARPGAKDQFGPMGFESLRRWARGSDATGKAEGKAP